MEIAGEYQISAPRQRVWDALNNPEILRESLPGCKALDQTGANEFTATVAARVGPVSATFKGKVELSELDPPNGYKLSGRGQGGAAGFANGSARVHLEALGEETLLKYTAGVDVGGKLAAVGNRLIGGVAKGMADEFFGNFAKIVTGEAPQKREPPPASAADAAYAPSPRADALRKPSTNKSGGGAGFLLIDRLAWLVAGMGLGMLATLHYLGRL